jgi:hypothetical protein
MASWRKVLGGGLCRHGDQSGHTLALEDIDKHEKLPIEFEAVFTEEVFRHFYYELDYVTLEAFWNGWREE